MTERENLLQRLEQISSIDELPDIADGLLALDNKDPYGLYLSWCLLGSDEQLGEDKQLEHIDLLQDAYHSIHEVVHGKEIAEPLEDRDFTLFMTIAYALGLALIDSNGAEEALAIARDMVHHDEENLFKSRELLYASMAALEMWDDILDFQMDDTVDCLASSYTHALALLETGEPSADVAEALYSAITVAPRIPLYILDILEYDGEEISEPFESDVQGTIDFLVRIWTEKDEPMHLMAMFAFPFAYMRGYLKDKKEIKFLEDLYSKYDLLKKLNTARIQIEQSAAKGKGAKELDEEALLATKSLLKDIEIN